MVAIVQQKHGAVTDASLGLTVTLDSATTNGNRLVALVSLRRVIDTMTSGFTEDVASIRDPQPRTHIFSKEITSGQNSISVTGTDNDYIEIELYELDPCEIDVTASDGSGGSQTDTQSTGTTASNSTNDAIALASLGCDQSLGAQLSVTNGFTLDFGHSNSQAAMAHLVISSQATRETTFDWTGGATRRAQACIAVYKATGGGGGGSPFSQAVLIG